MAGIVDIKIKFESIRADIFKKRYTNLRKIKKLIQYQNIYIYYNRYVEKKLFILCY